jgi:hypothetical protein
LNDEMHCVIYNYISLNLSRGFSQVGRDRRSPFVACGNLSGRIHEDDTIR